MIHSALYSHKQPPEVQVMTARFAAALFWVVRNTAKYTPNTIILYRNTDKPLTTLVRKAKRFTFSYRTEPLPHHLFVLSAKKIMIKTLEISIAYLEPNTTHSLSLWVTRTNGPFKTKIYGGFMSNVSMNWGEVQILFYFLRRSACQRILPEQIFDNV